MSNLFPTESQSEYGAHHFCFMARSDLVAVYDPYGRAFRVSQECLIDFRRHKIQVPIRTRKGGLIADLPKNHIARRGGDSIHRDNIRLTKPEVTV